ncbi:DNA-binding transcriptional LysR family regulator [Paraburkholderia sp. GAS448]
MDQRSLRTDLADARGAVMGLRSRHGCGIFATNYVGGRTDASLVRLLPEQIALTRSYWLVSHAETRDVARVKLLADFIRSESEASPSFWAA